MVPESHRQKLSGIIINRVLALSISVKIIIEKNKDPIITNGLFLSLVVSDPPNITGISGKTHGANAVRMPAKNAIKIISINYLVWLTICSSVKDPPHFFI